MTQYTYNSRNLVETITRPSGQQATNIYDPALRLSQVIDSYATTVYQYDPNGRLIETNDNANGGATTTRAYDSLGRLTGYTDEAGNTIGYGYDPAGNLVRLTYPDGKVVTYNYDQNNRLITVTDWAGRITTYTYDDNGRLVTTAFPNQTQETRTYDASGKLTGIQHPDPSGDLIYGCTYQIDAAGRISSATLNPAPTSFGVPIATMSFDADNRLTQIDGMVVSFDSDGNMTNGPSVQIQVPTIYSYDARNRLAASGRIGYYYNPDGRGTSLTDYNNNINGVATNFVIDPSGSLDRTLVQAKGGTLTYYVYGLGLIGQEQNGVYQNYHFDSRGSTVAITDSDGSVTDRFEYGPYGEGLSHNGSTDTPFKFNGRYGVQTDRNGLLYMRARYYNPAIRRFVNQDVVFGQISSGISLNRFAFANGNPVSLMDPFGLCAQSDPWSQVTPYLPQSIYPYGGSTPTEIELAYQSGQIDFWDYPLIYYYDQGRGTAVFATATDLFPVLLLTIGTAGIAEEAAPLVQALESAAEGTGTVWDAITATQDTYSGTVIPRSFTLSTSGADVWVAPNATEHLAEYALVHALPAQ